MAQSMREKFPLNQTQLVEHAVSGIIEVQRMHIYMHRAHRI